MASFARFAPVALAGLLVAGGASAQPGGPRMPPGHPMAQGASFGPDCAVSAIEVVAQPRRTMAVVDVGLRFRSNKGGNCMARAEAVQITTGKAGAVSRAFSELVQDDQLQKPIAVADAPGGERLRPWMTQMKPGEEKTIVYRFYVDGDVLVGSEVDPASRVRVDLRALGTRVLEHTPITVSLVLPQSARGKLSLQTGNPKGTTQNVGTTAGKAEIKQSLTKDDLLPVIDFKVESELPPAVTPATLTPGLGTLEYMRDGFARELATALDGNKDEKKVAEAWDRAYDLAFMALRSTDPIVAGHGVRTMAWLASGLSPAATHVRAEGESGDGVVVPASIAKEASAAMTVYGNLTGQRTAPSPVGARSVRLVLPRLGEPGSHKKEAEEGLKRLAKRVEKKEVTETKFADTFAALAFPKVGAGAPATSRAIVFGPKGPQFVGEGKGGHAAPKRAFAGRMTRYLTHGRGVLKVFFGITALGGLGVLIYLAMSRVKGSTQEGASSAVLPRGRATAEAPGRPGGDPSRRGGRGPFELARAAAARPPCVHEPASGWGISAGWIRASAGIRTADVAHARAGRSCNDAWLPAAGGVCPASGRPARCVGWLRAAASGVRPARAGWVRSAASAGRRLRAATGVRGAARRCVAQPRRACGGELGRAEHGARGSQRGDAREQGPAAGLPDRAALHRAARATGDRSPDHRRRRARRRAAGRLPRGVLGRLPAADARDVRVRRHPHRVHVAHQLPRRLPARKPREAAGPRREARARPAGLKRHRAVRPGDKRGRSRFTAARSFAPASGCEPEQVGPRLLVPRALGRYAALRAGMQDRAELSPASRGTESPSLVTGAPSDRRRTEALGQPV